MELYHSGDVNGAIESFEACVQQERSLYNSTSEARTDSWRMLGVCHADNDEDKKAIVCLNHAIDCDPYNLDALLSLGQARPFIATQVFYYIHSLQNQLIHMSFLFC